VNTPKQAASLFLAANGYANLTGMVVRGNGVIFLPALLFASCVSMGDGDSDPGLSDGMGSGVRGGGIPRVATGGSGGSSAGAPASGAGRGGASGGNVDTPEHLGGAAGRGDGDAGEGGAGGFEEVPCTELTDLAYVRRWGPGDGERTSYELVASELDEGVPIYVWLTFDASYDPGTFELEFESSNDVPHRVGASRGETTFRSVSGSVVVDPRSEHITDDIVLAELFDVTVKHAKRVNPWTYRLTRDGECFHIPYAKIHYNLRWTCPEDWYTDLSCDCGCGAPDPACETNVGTDVCARCGCEGKPCIEDENWECISYPPPPEPDTGEGGTGGGS
jgi:hypothetical protein